MLGPSLTFVHRDRLKIREGLAANDYQDPGSYYHPAGTVAFEFKDKIGEAPQPNGQVGTKRPAGKVPTKAGHKGHL